ncbi:2638_t:CDS:2, partial [Funneliformis geosporum]
FWKSSFLPEKLAESISESLLFLLRLLTCSWAASKSEAVFVTSLVEA